MDIFLLVQVFSGDSYCPEVTALLILSVDSSNILNFDLTEKMREFHAA